MKTLIKKCKSAIPLGAAVTILFIQSCSINAGEVHMKQEEATEQDIDLNESYYDKDQEPDSGDSTKSNRQKTSRSHSASTKKKEKVEKEWSWLSWKTALAAGFILVVGFGIGYPSGYFTPRDSNTCQDCFGNPIVKAFI